MWECSVMSNWKVWLEFGAYIPNLVGERSGGERHLWEGQIGLFRKGKCFQENKQKIRKFVVILMQVWVVFLSSSWPWNCTWDGWWGLRRATSKYGILTFEKTSEVGKSHSLSFCTSSQKQVIKPRKDSLAFPGSRS